MRKRSKIGCPTAIVAIPVCNEAERIGACLAALAGQSGVELDTIGVLLFLNNCVDRTAAIVAATDVPFPVRVIERSHAQASAGWARRIAMEEAADWLRSGIGGGAVLLTTDADSQVAPDWIARNLAAIGAGASAVAGCLALDPAEAALLPAALHARGRREGAYEAMLTEICARLDPEPGNPWPCHWAKSGATIAVTLEAYERVGGMPDQPTGEDRAFIDAVVAHDLVVRHDPAIRVMTSGRLDGRATGGVADTIRLRCKVPESPCDDRLEPARRVISRCLLRRRLRGLWTAGTSRDIGHWATNLSIPDATALDFAASPVFGQAYAAVEAASPKLDFRPIRPRQLPLQIAIAWGFLGALRLRDRLTGVLVSRPALASPSIGDADKAIVGAGATPRLRAAR